MKKKVLLFARSFLAKYYSDIKSDIIEPIFVTLTHEEKVFLESIGWSVYGCFEDEYDTLPVTQFPGNYLRTSFQSDRFLNRFNYDKRMEILGKEISFWSRVMDITKPDFLVNETVAVEIAEVMAIEAQKRNIPFYTYLLGFLPNTFYWKPNPFTGRLASLDNIAPTEDHIQKAKEYVSSVVEKNNRPFYVTNVKKNRITIKTILHSWLKNKIMKKKQRKLESKMSFKYEDYSLFTENDFHIHSSFFKGEYDSIENIEKKHVIFLPMHMEPEAILNYFVEENFDQLMLINTVLSCLKADQYLVVKEHPQQQGVLLTKRYQDLKKKNCNLIYLPSHVLSLSIIKKSDAIITLTSTVAWEGLMLGKPAFVIGQIFYDQCNGVKRVDSFKQLKYELRKDVYEKPNHSSVIEYVAKMISLLHEGCPSPIYKSNTINAFVRAIENFA